MQSPILREHIGARSGIVLRKHRRLASPLPIVLPLDRLHRSRQGAPEAEFSTLFRLSD